MRLRQGLEFTMNLFHIHADRRRFLRSAGAGFGSIALAALLAEEGELGAADGGDEPRRSPDPLVPKAPHFPAKAKRVIFLFMSGGPSHLDTFDPKPQLAHLH